MKSLELSEASEFASLFALFRSALIARLYKTVARAERHENEMHMMYPVRYCGAWFARNEYEAMMPPA